MRLLCLHGRGTCAEIFKMQTARIREQLDDHEFVFLNGTVSTKATDGAASITGDCYGYIPDDFGVGQCQALLLGLIQFIKSRGPFDGVLGFSEGGIVAAMLLIEDARHHFAHFRCGIFFSAAPPFDPDVLSTGVIRCMDPTLDGAPIGVPTAHIFESDTRHIEHLRSLSPLNHMWSEAGVNVSDMQESLVRLCDKGTREVFLHDQGHVVPGAKSVEALSGTVRAIERTIERSRP